MTSHDVHSPASQSSPDGPNAPAFLPVDEQLRLKRLFDRTIGHGFKLAVIETPTPSDGERLLDWLRPQFDDREAVEHDVDLVALLGRADGGGPEVTNVWAALKRAIPPESVADHRAVLVVRGFEDLMYHGAEGRSDLLQQFNVQRDLFVRDYPCWWLLLVHPASRQRWHKVAPDFADFVALWVESPLTDSSPSRSVSATYQTMSHSSAGSIGFGAEDWPEPLRAAFEDIVLSRYDKAIDRLHAFVASVPDTPETELSYALAGLLETDVLVARGEINQALNRLQQDILPTFVRLNADRAKAVTLSKIADILQVRGELNESFRIVHDEVLPVFKQLGDVRSEAIVLGKLADVLQSRGELEEAIHIRRDKELPVYERLGDIRLMAITQGKIADVLQTRGELDEVLRIRREEQLPIYKRLGDERLAAITQGRIADVLQTRGELDEALRIRRDEELPVYERLGEVRETAVAHGKIADVIQASGDLDESLRIRRDKELPVYERIGDARAVAVTRGKIADVLEQRGDLNEALSIRRSEELPVYERLDDQRLVAITRGKIADVFQQRGDLNEALRIRRDEVLPVLYQLGDERELLIGQAKLAMIQMEHGAAGDRLEAAELLRQAHTAAERMGTPEAGQIRIIQEREGLGI